MLFLAIVMGGNTRFPLVHCLRLLTNLSGPPPPEPPPTPDISDFVHPIDPDPALTCVNPSMAPLGQPWEAKPSRPFTARPV